MQLLKLHSLADAVCRSLGIFKEKNISFFELWMDIVTRKADGHKCLWRKNIKLKGICFADKYLEALADSGKLISRTVADHKKIFEQVGLAAKCETKGNILSIQCEK